MSAQRVTMREVALRAGVSRTTASFVLSGRSDMRVSAAVWQRVLEAAEALGYRPNVNARALRTSQTQTLGLVSDTIATTQFAGDVIRGAVDAATSRERLLLIAETEGNPALESRMIGAMLDRQVDGFVYGAMSTRQVQLSPMLVGQQVVLLNCFDEYGAVSAVIPDERQGGRTAASALYDAGHRDGVFVIGGVWKSPTSPEGRYAGHERLAGIDGFARAAGLRIEGVIEVEWHTDRGHDAVAELLTGHAPRALICMNDRIALGAYQALQERGLRIPDDVSIVSFDDQEMASWLRPTLSSIALPHYEMGLTAVRQLIEGAPQATVRLPMELRRRDSIGTVAV